MVLSKPNTGIRKMNILSYFDSNIDLHKFVDHDDMVIFNKILEDNNSRYRFQPAKIKEYQTFELIDNITGRIEVASCFYAYTYITDVVKQIQKIINR